MKKYYLASNFWEQERLKDYRNELHEKQLGEVTSRWLDVGADLNVKKELHELGEYAVMDLADILRSDCFVLINNVEPSVGRHVEFGYALGIGIELFVIGKGSSLFHYVPAVTHFDTWDEFVDSL